jgi:membrane protein implicated in regulation of membrane protease activity
VPGIGAVFRVVQQRLEERRLQPFEVALGLADDVARHELRRVLEHVDEAVQLAQDVVGHVPGGLGLAIHVDRNIEVLAPHLLDELAQVQHHRVQVRAGRELLVVDGQDEGAGARLLLRELRQVAITGHAQHLEALGLDGLRQRTDAQARGILGAEVFVDDDDGKAEFHACSRIRRRQRPPRGGGPNRRRVYGNTMSMPGSVPHIGSTMSRCSYNPWQEMQFMADSTLWWLATGIAVAVEMATGTYYLLMVATGMAAAAVAAHLGLGLAAQCATAAIVGSGATFALYLRQKNRPAGPAAAANPDVVIDVGNTVHVDAWQADGTTSVMYRGARWTAVHRAGLPAPTGQFRIAEVVGNRLVLEKT